MTIRNLLIAIVILAFAGVSRAPGDDWITAPSYFTHDPQTGQRVTQYEPIGPFYTYPRGDFQRSGFRHSRSSIQVGGSADHYHVVEEWGRPVRPYGEWRFPYRPYSVPYQLWAPPFGFGAGAGFAPGFGFGFGGFGGVPPRGGFPPGFPGRPDVDPKDQLLPSLFGLPVHQDGRYLPYFTPDPFQRESLLPSDPPPIPGAPGLDDGS